MLPIQKTFADRIKKFKLTKSEIVNAVSFYNPLFNADNLDHFLSCNEPDYELAKRLAAVLLLDDEEFEELWYKTKDFAIRKKIKAKILQEKSGNGNLNFA